MACSLMELLTCNDAPGVSCTRVISEEDSAFESCEFEFCGVLEEVGTGRGSSWSAGPFSARGEREGSDCTSESSFGVLAGRVHIAPLRCLNLNYTLR